MLHNFLKTVNLRFMQVKLTGKDEEIRKVRHFFKTYSDDFRTIKNCSNQTGIDKKICSLIKYYLQSNNEIGCFYYGGNPHIAMYNYIISRFPQISNNSYILEIGPGGNPIFNPKRFDNWWGIDKNLEGKTIEYGQYQWNVENYPTDRILQSKWENLTNILNENNLIKRFDIIVASHVYEHTTEPIQCLIECKNALKPGGIIVLFVPDGFAVDSAKDPGHTLYLVKSMVFEFFRYAGGFEMIDVKPFRPDCDLVISAKKRE